MIKLPWDRGVFITGWFLTLLFFISVSAQLSSEYGCPTQERILPCRCSTRDMEIQIWQVSQFKKKIEKERSLDKIHFLFVSIGAATVSYQKFSRA